MASGCSDRVRSDGNDRLLVVFWFGEFRKLGHLCSSFPPLHSIYFEYIVVFFFLDIIRVRYFNDVGLLNGEAV